VKRILVVEDDLKIAASLQIRLQKNDYHVVLAHDAVQGTSLAVKLRPDLIILDISLPGGNGLALAHQFKKLPETAEIPIVAITASKAPQLREKAMTLQLAGFFEKPYEIQELLAVIRSALQRHDFTLQQGARLERPRLESARAEAPSYLSKKTPSERWCPSGKTPQPQQPQQPARPSASKGARAEAPRLEGARAEAPETHSQIKKILIIEDDTNIAMALALRIKAAGYQTVLAFDALLGLSHALNISPELVLLDISMPTGNGLEVAHQIRTLLAHPPPIIFLTASKQQGLREKARRLGAVAFFEKPYQAEDLIAAINNTLQNSENSL